MPYQVQTQSIPKPQEAPPLQGRIVSSAEEILPGEVPMNGTTSIFPLADGSGIITKTWGKDGLIKQMLYVPPFEEQKVENEKEDSTSIILERLDKIEKLIAKNNKGNYNKKSFNNKNRQGENNGYSTNSFESNSK